MLVKSRINSKEVLLSKAALDLVINPDEFVLINNVWEEYYDMKEKIKNYDNE